jgi:hypothetical protein
MDGNYVDVYRIVVFAENLISEDKKWFFPV